MCLTVKCLVFLFIIMKRNFHCKRQSSKKQAVTFFARFSYYKSKWTSPILSQKRTFWEYVNMMFNKPDEKRIKELGPDRACAEWVLRNGGSVVWANGKKITNYNLLPSEEQSVPKIMEIDGTNSSISHYGFSHLSGCTMLQKIKLHENKYIDDRAMKGLSYGQDTLKLVQVSKCPNVTDAGLKELKILSKLEVLTLFSLESVENLESAKQYLKTQLPKCKIDGAEVVEK